MSGEVHYTLPGKKYISFLPAFEVNHNDQNLKALIVSWSTSNITFTL